MTKRVMVAGIGNAFMKDDGFGGAVVKRLQSHPPKENVVIKDFGTGGLKLAYDLLQGYDALILVDAVRRGGAPGTLYMIEPAPGDIPREATEDGMIDPHGADVTAVLRFVKASNAWPPKVLIIGCEPQSIPSDTESFENDDAFEIGLSVPVEAAADRAASWVQATIVEIEHAH